MSTDTQVKRQRMLLALAILLFAAMAVAWQWSPLRAWLDIDVLVQALKQLGQEYGPIAAILGFAIGLTVAVPLTFLTVVTIVAFGPVAGLVYCLIGAQLGAVSSYYLGVFLGRDVVQKLGGTQVAAVSARLAHRGLLSVIAVRMVPIAPFAVVNMIAGAIHIRTRDLLLGTLLGMTPGALAIAYFVNHIVDALRQPNEANPVFLALALCLIALASWAARRWLNSAQTPD